MKTTMPRTLRTALAALAFAVAVPVMSAPQTARAEVPAVKRIAMVDMQRVLNETKEGKKARTDLETSSKAKQEKLDKKRTKLEADAAKLGSLKGAQLASAQEQLQKESMELQSMLMTLEQELGDMHNKTLESMYKRAQDIVTKLAKERGIDLVLVRDAMTVIYVKDGIDITDEIVKLYNGKHS
jgi:outer membrane protein